LPVCYQLSAKVIGTQPPKKTKALPANASHQRQNCKRSAEILSDCMRLLCSFNDLKSQVLQSSIGSVVLHDLTP